MVMKLLNEAAGSSLKVRSAIAVISSCAAVAMAAIAAPYLGLAVGCGFMSAGLALRDKRYVSQRQSRLTLSVQPKTSWLWLLFWFHIGAGGTITLLMRHRLYENAVLNVFIAVFFLLLALMRSMWHPAERTNGLPMTNRVLALLFGSAALSLILSPLDLGARQLAVWGSVTLALCQAIFIALEVRRTSSSIGLLRDMVHGVTVGFLVTVSTLVATIGVGADRFGVPEVLHPNTVGALAGLLLVGTISLGQVTAIWHRGFALVSLPIVLVLAFSKTSLIAVVVSLTIWLVGSMRWSRTHRLLAVASALLLIIQFAGPRLEGEIASYLSRLDRVESLSGRTELWQETLMYSARRPLLGYGFATFADVLAPSNNLGWNVYRISNAHNAYLTILLEQGYIGLGLFLYSLLLALSLQLRVRRAEPRSPFSLFSFVVLGFLLVRSVTEGSLALKGDFLYLLALIALSESVLRLSRTEGCMRVESVCSR